MRTKFYAVIIVLVLSNLAFYFVNNDLSKENELLKTKLNAANINLDFQNERIKALSVEIKPTEIKEVERIKKIYVKDNTCEAELKAYKELFNEIN
ncbi:hypothetical protein AVBRAN12640_05350 [Campylobacter sp. RM12640]|uniref:hypothetical protein n=1 Tax=unclassified Campylobacter TaxID=2593542 RepID=UPI001DFA7AAB|nr:hypothetical protein [Campylobacter sp. RM12640]MBZ7989998.1 hypothetical protein [Campylobacter sp. RM12635]MBZ8007902.1 hypothetical protein [Campylobacter sp. RM9334]